MDEVALAPVRHALQRRAGEIGAAGAGQQRFPGDVGHPLGRAGGVGGGQAAHPAGDQAQALVGAELVRTVKQHLHPQADAQQRRPLAHPAADGLGQPAAAQFGHAVPERPHPGQHQRLGGQHRGGVAGQFRHGAAVGQRPLHAE